MAQRQEALDSLDDFPSPAWSARALVEYLIPGPLKHRYICWEPACNRGYMLRGLVDYFPNCTASDVFDYGLENAVVHDFLQPFLPQRIEEFGVAWIITNPPFRLAQQFILRALDVASLGVAMLVRTQFLEGVQRYHRLFADHPPTKIGVFAERVPMVKGRCDRSASTATSYCWLVWVKGCQREPLTWIPPCRKYLERESDYA